MSSEIRGDNGTTHELTDEEERNEICYRLFFENSGNALFLAKPDGRVLAANPAAQSMFQMSEEEIKAVGRDSLVLKDSKLERAIRERTERGKVTAELTCRRKDGETFPCEATSTMFVDADGTLSNMVSIRDITEHKLAEQALKNALEMARRRTEEIETLLDVAPVGIWVAHDPDGKVITGNQAASGLYGRHDDDRGSGVMPSTSQAAPRNYDTDGVEIKPEGLPMQIAMSMIAEVRGSEITTILPSGRKIITICNAKPLFDEYGNVRGGITSVIDITGRKRMEESLMEERSRLQTILDTLQVGVSVADAHGNIVLRNQLMYEYLGSNARSSDFSDLALFRVYYPGSSIRLNAEEMPVSRALRGDVINDEELEIVRANGARVIVLASARSIKNKEGGLIGALGVFTDITRLKKLGENLKRSNDELQQFAYIASHDLQEPLRMVTSYLGLLKKKYGHDLPPQAEEYMDMAVDGSRRMKGLIDDLLEYSRVDTRTYELRNIDMDELARSVAQDLHVAINESGVELAIEQLPTIRADEIQMKQLLTNLISNAIKFHDGRPPRIIVSAIAYENEYVFSVKDNGIGIDPKYQDKLFKMFSRLHTREEYPGTGIGLAISKKIVERHGGRIWFESEPGKGATFFFTIPT
ncbi:MAG: PAS domain S-box protein [Methanomassiliicoccus sp.]|nr:PAS domain S-box protein [Methanomassiliicoccus sp.]